VHANPKKQLHTYRFNTSNQFLQRPHKTTLPLLSTYTLTYHIRSIRLLHTHNNRFIPLAKQIKSNKVHSLRTSTHFQPHRNVVVSFSDLVQLRFVRYSRSLFLSLLTLIRWNLSFNFLFFFISIFFIDFCRFYNLFVDSYWCLDLYVYILRLP
jgi:hypothetical protein